MKMAYPSNPKLVSGFERRALAERARELDEAFELRVDQLEEINTKRSRMGANGTVEMISLESHHSPINHGVP